MDRLQSRIVKCSSVIGILEPPLGKTVSNLPHPVIVMALSGAALDHREQRFHNRIGGIGSGNLIDPLPHSIINGNGMPILPTFESVSVLYNSFGFPSRTVDVETED